MKAENVQRRILAELRERMDTGQVVQNQVEQEAALAYATGWSHAMNYLGGGAEADREEFAREHAIVHARFLLGEREFFPTRSQAWQLWHVG